MNIRKYWIVGLLFIPSLSWATYSGYTYRQTITISSANVQSSGGNLSNFPVLVSSNNVSLSTTAGSGGRLNSSGMDLIFSTMSDCSYNLYWDTETVQNVGVSTMNVWVNVPVLTTATLTAATFYMCYGNAGVTTYQGFSTKTWDSNFKGVWHLPNGTTLGALDSTGVNNGSITETAATTGKVDGAGSFDGSNDVIALTDNDTLDIQTGDFTVSAWVRKSGDTGAGYYQTIIGKGISGDGGTYTWILAGTNDETFYFALYDTTNNPSVNSSGASYVESGFTHVVAVYKQADNTTALKLYINGALDNTATRGNYTTATNQSSTARMGRWPGNQDWRGWLYGISDEVRISNAIRSADWIKTEYNNQNSPTTFITIGSETTSGGASVISKVGGVSYAAVSKVGGVAKASISKIGSVGP